MNPWRRILRLSLLGILVLGGCSREEPIPIATVPPPPGAEKHAFTRAESHVEFRPGSYLDSRKDPAGGR